MFIFYECYNRSNIMSFILIVQLKFYFNIIRKEYKIQSIGNFTWIEDKIKTKEIGRQNK